MGDNMKQAPKKPAHRQARDIAMVSGAAVRHTIQTEGNRGTNYQQPRRIQRENGGNNDVQKDKIRPEN